MGLFENVEVDAHWLSVNKEQLIDALMKVDRATNEFFKYSSNVLLIRE